jgi:two-component system nitrogen regulation sensor histidine kinase NtrY
LVVRAVVKLTIDRKKGAFGSRLRTKLVASFVAFAVLPTMILLYTTGKFVDTNIEKWLPASLVETSRVSAKSEQTYQQLILRSLDAFEASAISEKRQSLAVDFVYDLERQDFLVYTLDPVVQDAIKRRIELAAPRLKEKGSARWIPGHGKAEHPIVLRRVARDTVAGLVGPMPLHPGWQAAERAFADADTGIDLLRLSFYTMLAVLSLLIIFAAAWMGFTVARELSKPLLALSRAAERVAQGHYAVEIDDFVSDDEVGVLAKSFRSMVADLRSSHEQAALAAQELASKAQELERNLLHKALLVEHVHSGIVSASHDGTIKTWNRTAENLFGIRRSQAEGRGLSEVLDSEFYAATLAPCLQEPLSKDAEPQSYRGVLDGRERHLRIRVVGGDQNGQKQGVPEILVLIDDLTELERAQRVAAWRDVARRVAHEIKNPLTPISLAIQRIQRRFINRLEGTDLEVFQESVRVVVDSAESIRRLVEEFNRFARMPQALMRVGSLVEAVELALVGFSGDERSGVALRVCVEDPLDGAQHEVPREGWSECSKKYPAAFDKDQIVRMVTNLVSNAVEACEGHREKVEVTIVFALAESSCYIVVTDQGPGVPKNMRSLIFEPYFSTRRKGSGLGLPIVRQIVTEHGGDVSVFDNVPHGSIFKVALPILVSKSGAEKSHTGSDRLLDAGMDD